MLKKHTQPQATVATAKKVTRFYPDPHTGLTPQQVE